jgi:protein-tyrosine phosphatase
MRAEVYSIKGPWSGQLAILARPRGNDWLVDEVQSWRDAGVNLVVSLLTTSENLELGLLQESQVSKDLGLDFVSFPIDDYSVPKSEDSVIQLTCELHRVLSQGKCVGIHCRQSIGRSGLIAACLLVAAGETPTDAFEKVSAGRRAAVPDTVAQREWVYKFANNLRSGSSLSFAK